MSQTVIFSHSLKATSLGRWTIWIFCPFSAETHCSCRITMGYTYWHNPTSIWVFWWRRKIAIQLQLLRASLPCNQKIYHITIYWYWCYIKSTVGYPHTYNLRFLGYRPLTNHLFEYLCPASSYLVPAHIIQR